MISEYLDRIILGNERVGDVIDSLIESRQSMGHVALKDLPPGVQSHIKDNLRLNPQDVAVHVGTHAVPCDAYGDGHRAHFALVHNAGEKPAKLTWGSWGGSNPFERKPVDVLAGNEVPIPPGHAAVMGSSQRRVMSVQFHPDDIAKLIPQQDVPDMSQQHFDALAIHKGIKGGHRREYLNRAGVSQQHVDDLVNQGLLARNKAGAVRVTTKGKNVHAQAKGSGKYKTSGLY